MRQRQRQIVIQILVTYYYQPQTTPLVPYADLAIVDLAKAATLEGRVELAAQVRDAMAKHGFFYAINHGYTSSQVRVVVSLI